MPRRGRKSTKTTHAVKAEKDNAEDAGAQVAVRQKRNAGIDDVDKESNSRKRQCVRASRTNPVNKDQSPECLPTDKTDIDDLGIGRSQDKKRCKTVKNSRQPVKKKRSYADKQSLSATSDNKATVESCAVVSSAVDTDTSTKNKKKSTRAKSKLEKHSPAASGELQKVKIEVKSEMGSDFPEKMSGKLVGAHCSIAGALSNAVEEAVALGAKAFGLFVRSQRTWVSKPMTAEAAEDFKSSCKKHGFSPNSILPHGSYLMNCASPNPETLKKSREALLDELQRCEALGLTLYNFHPGSTCGEITVEEGLNKIAESINWAHEQTKYIITVIENMCCQGNTIGGRFEELKGIIDRVKDKSRIGVCLDTCHAFAAGFDLSCKEGFDKFASDFHTIVGFKYLRAMHLNDSKGDVGCHLDRHDNIGKGKIGLDGFRRIMNDPRFDGIPMILETPTGDYAKEIKLLLELDEKQSKV